MRAHANHLDLDPTYTDRFGMPLLRMTFDFPKGVEGGHAGVREEPLDVARDPGPWL